MDMLTVADYTHLTALFAPRPTLLIYNAQDDCCFQAARTLPAIYDPVVPIYELYGATGDFRFHINEDPGTHNYGQDNRIQFYNFVDEYLVPDADWGGEELATEGEILPVEQTSVGIPEDNATIVGTAIEIAKAIERPAIPTPDSADFGPWQEEHRSALRALLRYQDINLLTVACALESEAGSLTTAYQFKSADWTVAAAGLLPSGASPTEIHLVMDDGGLPATKAVVETLAGSDKHVVAIAPLFQAGTSPRTGNAWPYSMILNATGERSLAVQAAQLAAICDWFRTAKGMSQIQVHTRGAESGLIALTASALTPGLIAHNDTSDIPDSLIDIMEARESYSRTPSLYNFGFLRQFDFDILRAMAD